MAGILDESIGGVPALLGLAVLLGLFLLPIAVVALYDRRSKTRPIPEPDQPRPRPTTVTDSASKTPDDLPRFLRRDNVRPMTPNEWVVNSILSRGDLIIGEGVETPLPIEAAGDVYVGAHARLGGRIIAGGNVVVGPHASVAEVSCAGTLTLETGARIGGSFVARRGLDRGAEVEDETHAT